MVSLADLLEKKKAAIVGRWLEDTLATYSKDSAAAFRREKDQFANPVGHALRGGTQAFFDGLLEGIDAQKACEYLHDVIKIRAIQDFLPSQSISFVLSLKDAIRRELGKDIRNPQLSSELAGLEKQIDQIALLSFDVYMRYREQVYELRVNEVKRSVSKIIERMNRGSSRSETTGGSDRAENVGAR